MTSSIADKENRYGLGRFQYDIDDSPIPSNPSVFPRAIKLYPTGQVPVDPNVLMESCAAKVIASGIIGYGAGHLLGLVLGSYENIAPPVPIPGQRELPKVPIREHMKLAWRATSEKCKYWSNNFLIVTAVFSGVECLVEKSRAKHDLVNGSMAGCVTGAALAAGQGPQAMCLGCVGFAAFSAAIEHYTGH